MSANADLLPHEQPTALRNTLAQLGSGCLAAGVPLRLLEWPSTAGMMQALAECVPALAQLGNTATYNIDGPLTDDALSAVVSVGQIRHKFIAKGLALQSDQHASAPWPWGEITISRFDMPDLCKLPNPAGQGAPRKVSCSSVVLDNTLMQVGRKLHTVHHTKSTSNAVMSIMHCTLAAPATNVVLRASLSVVHSANNACSFTFCIVSA